MDYENREKRFFDYKNLYYCAVKLLTLARQKILNASWPICLILVIICHFTLTHRPRDPFPAPLICQRCIIVSATCSRCRPSRLNEDNQRQLGNGLVETTALNIISKLQETSLFYFLKRTAHNVKRLTGHRLLIYARHDGADVARGVHVPHARK